MSKTVTEAKTNLKIKCDGCDIIYHRIVSLPISMIHRHNLPVCPKCGSQTNQKDRGKRVKLTLIPSKHPGSLCITADTISEALAEEDMHVFTRRSPLAGPRF